MPLTEEKGGLVAWLVVVVVVEMVAVVYWTIYNTRHNRPSLRPSLLFTWGGRRGRGQGTTAAKGEGRGGGVSFLPVEVAKLHRWLASLGGCEIERHTEAAQE